MGRHPAARGQRLRRPAGAVAGRDCQRRTTAPDQRHGQQQHQECTERLQLEDLALLLPEPDLELEYDRQRDREQRVERRRPALRAHSPKPTER